MSDTYKGESLQKKVARLLTHEIAKISLNAMAPGAWEGGLHAFLASREGSEYGVLDYLGVPSRNLVGLERDEEAVRLCSEKWAMIEHEGQLVQCDDAGRELRWIAAILQRAQSSEGPVEVPLADGRTWSVGEDDWAAKWSRAR